MGFFDRLKKKRELRARMDKQWEQTAKQYHKRQFAPFDISLMKYYRLTPQEIEQYGPVKVNVIGGMAYFTSKNKKWSRRIK